ncbi:unnamed protein product, partial [Ilex paraguariensis]
SSPTSKGYEKKANLMSAYKEGVPLAKLLLVEAKSLLDVSKDKWKGKVPTIGESSMWDDEEMALASVHNFVSSEEMRGAFKLRVIQ